MVPHSARLLTWILLLFTPLGSPAWSQPVDAPAALKNYMQRDDDSFAWKLLQNHDLPQGKILSLELTSQTWQEIVWKHALVIYEPPEIKYPGHVLLMVSGGRTGGQPDRADMARGMALARLCGGRVAVLNQVPNQPLFDGRVEDDLITETWLKYLDTGDETWPLLFPMVKSAVKAMDAIQEVAQQQWQSPVEGFVITGASKRGWTSWLTPVVDSRIVATAPLVIDVLNFPAQMKHQIDTWGAYSAQIADYTSKGLIVTDDESPREHQLRLMMDPYTYREQLRLPKLLVNGTNDPYWVVDAMKWYWDDLKGPKYILQVPNAGHGLEGGVEQVMSTVGAFFRHTASSTPMPDIAWAHAATDDSISIRVTTSAAPRAARLWSADSNDKDFRDEHWTSRPLQAEEGAFIGKVERSGGGYLANYVELQYEIQGVPYSLCSLIFRD